MEQAGRKEVRREVRERTHLHHVAEAIALLSTNVRRFLNGGRGRFSDGIGSRMDVGRMKRRIADELLGETFAVIPEEDRPDALRLFFSEVLRAHRLQGVEAPEWVKDMARDAGVDTG